jgi:hypothetical protein
MSYDNILLELFNEANDANRLKQFLAYKLSRYGGITHSELELICTTFGIQKEEDEE